MGVSTYAESQNYLSLPNTPPDFTNFSSTPSSFPSSRYISWGQPPKDLSWPHPKPPISPPMSSHDQPLSRSSNLLSPVRPSSSSSGSMSTATSAPASMATTTVSSISSLTTLTAIAQAPVKLERIQSTAVDPSPANSPRTNAEQAALRFRSEDLQRQSAPIREQLPSLSSIFGPPESIRPLHPSPFERYHGASPTQKGPPPPLSLEQRHSPPMPYFSKISTPSGTVSQSLPQPPRSSFGGVLGPSDSRPATSLSDTYLRPYQSQQGRPPSPVREHVHYVANSYNQDQRSPVVREGLSCSPLHPPSPRSHEYEQHQQLEQQRRQRASSQTFRQWPDSRAGYVAVSKWATQHQDEEKQERPSYGEQKLYYKQHQNSESQRYPEPASASAGSRVPDNEFSQRQQQQQQQQPYHSQSVHYANPRHQISPPPPPQMQPSHSPVKRPSAPDLHNAQFGLAKSPSSLPNSMPTTPSTTHVNGGIPKEGMGPKIWTGVDFLPQFMHATEVPNEGLCYFYDDGSHCKAVIDGEAVNPYWGVTKAGKPRKRLAIACMTCREKKIKCDPEFPRCVQCEKFGRVCRFKNAPRGGNNTSPGTTSSEPDTLKRIGSSSMIRPPPESPQSISHPAGNLSNSPRVGMRRPLSPDYSEASMTSSKRSRTDYDYYTTTNRGRSPPYGNASPTPSADQHYRESMHFSSRPLRSSPPPPPSPQSQAYQRHQYHDYPRSQPSPPSQARQPQMLLPPPRSAPEPTSTHDDVSRRPWQSDLRPHGRV